jgi:glycosyltransferase involved in cell wall biosynthesis
MPNKTLTLTIVIPAHNEENQIKACLDSIAAQTTLPDEVIVVDNNSSDETARLARGYGFAKVIKENRQGVVYARNTGFNQASGSLIGRIDADTVLPADWVENLLNFYQETGAPSYFAVTSPSRFRNYFSWFWYAMHRLTYFWPSRLLMGHTTLVGSNMAISAALWKAVKNDVCIRTDIHEDMDLAHHINQLGTKILFSSAFSASVVARKMTSRLYAYPMMMLRVRTIDH